MANIMNHHISFIWMLIIYMDGKLPQKLPVDDFT